MTNIRKSTLLVGERAKELMKLSIDELTQEKLKYWKRLKYLPECLQNKMESADFTTQNAYEVVLARTAEYRAILHCIKLKRMQAKMEKLEGVA